MELARHCSRSEDGSWCPRDLPLDQSDVGDFKNNIFEIQIPTVLTVFKRAATHSETDFDAKSDCEQGKQHCGVWWCSTTTPVPPKVISMSKISYLVFFFGNSNSINVF